MTAFRSSHHAHGARRVPPDSHPQHLGNGQLACTALFRPPVYAVQKSDLLMNARRAFRRPVNRESCRASRPPPGANGSGPTPTFEFPRERQYRRVDVPIVVTRSSSSTSCARGWAGMRAETSGFPGRLAWTSPPPDRVVDAIDDFARTVVPPAGRSLPDVSLCAAVTASAPSARSPTPTRVYVAGVGQPQKCVRSASFSSYGSRHLGSTPASSADGHPPFFRPRWAPRPAWPNHPRFWAI